MPHAAVGGVVFQRGFNLLSSNVTDTVCLGKGDVSKLAPHNRILRVDPCVQATECGMRQRGATLMGLATRMAFVCRSCPCNAHNALCARHGVAAPVVQRDLSWGRDYFRRIRGEVLHLYLEQLAHWQKAWLEKWPAGKRAAIARSVEDDTVMPNVVHIMVKREVYDKEPTKARLIQFYPNLATQAAFGPEFFSLQKVYTQWFQRREVAPGIRVTFASGMNASDLGAWMRDVLADYGDPWFYERDGKNWDSTMQREHLAVRLAAYDVAGQDFLGFVRAGFSVRARDPRGAFRYTLEGTVKSGHNDTTLGNSLVNAVIAAIGLLDMRLRGDIIVAGDDLLTVVEGDFDEHALAGVEAACGIKPEYRKFSSPCDVSFISGIWFPLPAGQWLFTPKPGRLLSRLFWTVHPPADKRAAEYRNGIVAGLRGTCGAMPVVGAFLEAHVDATRGSTPNPAWEHRSCLVVESGFFYTRNDVFPAFLKRYGLSAEDVDSAEALLRDSAGRTGIVSHPVFDRLMDVDCSDLHDRPVATDL